MKDPIWMPTREIPTVFGISKPIPIQIKSVINVEIETAASIARLKATKPSITENKKPNTIRV